MEMGNVPKRQLPNHRADNSRMSPTGSIFCFVIRIQRSILMRIYSIQYYKPMFNEALK